MTQVNLININSPFLDQKPGTSGLRKSTLAFQEEHYLEIFIEAILQSLEDLQNSTLVVGGDGRYGNIEAIEKIVQICVAHNVKNNSCSYTFTWSLNFSFDSADYHFKVWCKLWNFKRFINFFALVYRYVKNIRNASLI